MSTLDGVCRVTAARVGRLLEVTFQWTSDAAGQVTHIMDDRLVGIPMRLRTRPIDAPADGHDITLLDELGVNVLLGKGDGRASANNQTAFIYDGTTPEVEMPVDGYHEFRVREAGNMKSGVAILTLKGVSRGDLADAAPPPDDGGGNEHEGPIVHGDDPTKSPPQQ